MNLYFRITNWGEKWKKDNLDEGEAGARRMIRAFVYLTVFYWEMLFQILCKMLGKL